MKVKYLGALLLAATLTFFGCDDNTGTLGIGMLPGSDGISAHTTTFDVTTRSVVADSVFAKTSTGYVGRFTDPQFGYYEASFLTELNCIDDFSFPEKYDFDKKTGILTDDTVAGVRLVVFYSTWFGDSLNACRMSAYELVKKLERNRYTNIKPTDYYDWLNPIKSLLGRRAYTAYDTSVTDEERNETDSNGNKTYYPSVIFTLDKDKFGNDWIDLCQSHPEYFKNSDAFIENVFKGVYIKSDYGDGTVLYVDRVDLQMKYQYYVLNDTTKVPYKRKQEGFEGQDSTAYRWQTEFASTKEVIQANQFLNSDKIAELAKIEDWTYIKSPAGIFTEAILPYDEIYEKLSNDTLNAVKLTFTNYNEKSDYEFSMSAPSEVLLLRKVDFKSFFEENKLPDNVTSFTVAHNNVTTNQYTFNNIARLVTTCIKGKDAAKKKAKEEAGSAWTDEKDKQWEEDWKTVYLIPVTISYDTSNNTKTMTGIQNDLRPGYAKLKGGPAKASNGELNNPLKLEVTYTTFNK